MSSASLKSRYRPRYEAQKHTNLCTVQRRLRHLTSIIGRNIDPNLVPSRRQTPKSNLLSLYFTVHAKDNENITLYKSETIENTLNPNWKEFDSKVFTDYQSYLQTSCVVIHIWGARKSSFFIKIIRYDVPFSGLIYVKEHLRAHDQSYESNSLLFGMFGGYYMAPSILGDASERNSNDAILSQNIPVEANNVQTSYKKSSLLRVHNSMKAIHETRQQVAQVKNAMEQLISENEHRKQKCAKREGLKFRNNLLRVEWEKLKQKLSVEKNSAQREQEEILHRKEELNRRRDELTQHICEMKVLHSTHIGHREMLLKVQAHLNFRRRQLAAELSYIYPIIELPMKDEKKDHTISGVQLPNSEDFIGKDENMLAVAIGNVAHLVFMMAKFMELPLRYPIRPMGSRSSVVDLVTDKLTDKQREFPLYLKGKEKFQFHYGVFLINKNIAQIRYHNGLGTADLRNTLINLKHLLEAKYGVRIVVKKDNSGFNKADLMANRSVSLPHRSTSSPIGPHSVRLNFEIPGGMPPEFNIPREHTQSDSLSGLPDVHVKMHQQHKFLARNSSTRLKKKTDSSLDSNEPPPSPDLLEVPFEDVVRRTIDGNLPRKNTENEDRENVEAGDLIDCGEDCLNGNLCDYNNLIEVNDDGCCSSSTRNGMQTSQVSDALIIPESFEREHDLSLSPSETIMV